MDALAHDLRFALRLIRKTPTLSIATIVTLALGIGLNAGVFSVVSGLLLRPRVIVDRDSFVHLQPEYSGVNVPVHSSPTLTTRDYLALRDRATTMKAVAAWTVRNVSLGESTRTSELALLVSCNFFEVYGLDRLERGRRFRPDECEASGPPVAIISDELWRKRFAADPDILDKPLLLDGQRFAIVGVTPPAFPGRVRGGGVWLPYSLELLIARGTASFADPASAWLWVDGRLKPDVSASAAAAEMGVLLRQQDSLAPGRHTSVALNNGALMFDPAVRPVAMFVMPLVLGSVGLVLLIACGNVTLLLLSRGVARQREIATRLALGCSRGRLARMLLTESVLLSAIGIPLSIWAAWQIPAAMRRAFPSMPFYAIDPDRAVLSYLAAVSLAAGFAAGLAPVLESLRQRLTPMLAGHDALSRGGRRSRVRDVLIAAQIGMTFVLCAGTAIFLRGERAIALRDPSVDAAHVMVAAYQPPRGAAGSFLGDLFASRLNALPGVRSVAYSAQGGTLDSVAPFMGVDGRGPETRRRLPLTTVSASYFGTMRQPLLQGSGFDPLAASASPRPLVISDALARVWWPGADAIGARLTTDDHQQFEVVGVVHADAAFTAGTADSIQAFVLPPPIPPSGSLFFRFEGDPGALQAAIHRMLLERTPDAATVATTLAASDAEVAARFMPMVEMVGSLGATAIVLALVGVYGVVSFAVGRRTREIGVRVALGATHGDIVAMILSTGTPPVACGLCAGLVLSVPAAIALNRIFAFTPVPLHVGDPFLYAAVTLALACVTAATMLVPARRAATIPPSSALRME